jgi:hypothetical protein
MAYALSESIEEADDADLHWKQVYHTTISKPPSTSTSSTTAFSSLTPETTPIHHHERHVQLCPTTAPLNTPTKSPSSTLNDHMHGYSLRKYYANEVYRRNGRTRQQPLPAPNPHRLVRNRRKRPYAPHKQCNACNRIGRD